MYLCFRWWKHNTAGDKQTKHPQVSNKKDKYKHTHLVQHKRFVLDAVLLLLHMKSINPFSFTFSTLRPSARLPSRWQSVQRTGVKLLELWRSFSGASPIKVIFNSWILPFDGRVIPFGSHSLALNAFAPRKQDQEMLAVLHRATCAPLLSGLTYNQTHLARHSKLHALLSSLSES